MIKIYRSLITLIIFFVMILTSIVGYAHNVESTVNDTNASLVLLNTEITIPDDYASIQQGIDNAKPGDTILVRTGIYKENLIINKTGLTLAGVDKYNTILDGSKASGQGIVIKADNVVIKNFTITNYKDQGREEIYCYDQSAIEIHKANTTIHNNRIIENGVGIELYINAFNTTITSNEMIHDGMLIGNYLDSWDFPNITPKCFDHTIEDNTVNGKPLYYYKNQQDFTVPTDAGQITMLNCTNFTIKNTYMNNNDFSMLLAFCYDSLIENNTITDTTGENLFFACENLTIQNNKFVDNFKAICLEYKSKNNIVRFNDISESYVAISLFNNASNNLIYQNKIYNNSGPMAAGIEVVSYHGGTQLNNNISKNQIYNNPIGIKFRGNTTNTAVYKNNITNNKMGIYLEASADNNHIISNNFRKNTIHAFFNGCSTNNWDNNYWNRPRVLPKAIFGFKPVSNIKIPYMNFDKNPALTPYEI